MYNHSSVGLLFAEAKMLDDAVGINNAEKHIIAVNIKVITLFIQISPV